MFSLNQIVKGKTAGQFIIIGFRTIAGEQYAQLKSYDAVTGQAGRGEIALPLDAIDAL